MKILTFLIVILIVTLNFAKAQNSMFLDPLKENITNGSLKKIVPKEISDFFDTDKYFDAALSDFTKLNLQTNYYSGNTAINDVLQSNFYDYFLNNQNENTDYHSIFAKLRETVFKNKTFFESAYNILIQHYKTAFSKMTNGETDAYLNAVKNAIQYAENFDLKKEMADEEKLDYLFAYEKGNITAFIYRRIKNNELTKEECISWLNRIYNDLKSAVKIKSGIENYYLVQNSFGNYYRAKTYDTLENYVFLLKNKNGYQTLDKNQKIVATSFFNNIKIHLLINQKSGNEYNNELFGLLDAPYTFSSNKAIKYVIPALNGDNKYENYFFVNYEDGSVELINTETNSKTTVINKIQFETKFKDGLYTVQYSDKSFDVFSFNGNNNFVKKSFDSEFLELVQLEKPNEFLLKLKSGDVYYIRNKNLEMTKLAPGINYLTFNYWKNFIIFSIGEKDKLSNVYSYKYGVLAADAKLLLEPVYDDFVIPGSNAEFVLMCESNNGQTLCTPYDYNFKKIENTKIINVMSVQLDPETFEEIRVYKDTLDTKDNTIILKSKMDEKNSQNTEYDIMLDPKGNKIISEKWAIIERINIPEAKNNLYKVRDSYDPENPSAGKWALFNHEGKQLTKFEFDKIGNFEHGLIPAINKDKFVFFDKDGEITKTANLQDAENEAGSDIYFLLFNDKTCAVVNKKNFTLSETVYQQIIDEIVVFDPDNFEETINVVKERIDSTDKTFIIFKNEYSGERIVNQKRVLLNFEGKLLIDQYSERIICPGAEHNLYRVSEHSFYKTEPELSRGPEGKFALFNHLGKQLTKFVYEEISEANEKGQVEAIRNGQKVLLDKKGKEVK